MVNRRMKMNNEWNEINLVNEVRMLFLYRMLNFNMCSVLCLIDQVEELGRVS